MLNENDRNILLFRSRFLKQKDYWIRKLSGKYDLTGIFLDFHNVHPVEVEEGKIEILFPAQLGIQVLKLSKGSDLSIYILLLAALKTLIFRYTSGEEIIIISPTDKLKTTEETINTHLFIRDRVELGMTFKEMVLTVRQSVLEAYENQDYPYDKLLEYLLPGLGCVRLTDIECSLEAIHGCSNLDKYRSRLLFSFVREGDLLRGNIRYNAHWYEECHIKKLGSHFIQLLESALRDVDRPISRLPFLSREEREQLVRGFNNTTADYPAETTIIQLFEKQVAKTPHHAAVVFGGLHIDYEQLNRQADRIAALLREKGVKIGSIVGIKGEHSDWIIAGILGVLKTGGAYLPMQVEDPPERLRFMLNDSKAVVLIAQEYFAQEMLAQAAAVSQENIVLIEALAENVKDMRDIRVDEEPAAQARPDEPAYVIYTSGTTGAPKGVPVSHRNLVNYICWAARTYVKDEPVNFPLYTSIAFDLTVTSIFTPLVTGNSVIVYAGGNKRALIEEIVDEDRVEVIKLTPSHLKLLKYKKLSAKGVRLKRLILGGENLGVSEAREIHEKFNGAVEIYNEYGPTEATVGCMIHKFNPENDNRESVPIGIPISNSRIYLLTDSQEPVPVGAKGELYISGDGVARGYLNRPGFTAEKFIPDPFCPGNIMYRSGDLASRSLDGNFEFSGRIDDQVKIRGFRVELGEIETRLASFPGVKEAVVLAQEEEKGDKYLCAFVVSDDKNTVSELREYLTKELPDYMIPSYFVPLEKIPLTPNGKIDRKALPKTQLKAGENYIAPRNEIEKKLVELWAEILGRESLPASQLEKSIGINDNFFQLGGHSLKATVLVSKIHREFNVKVPLVEIFKTPILREMATLIVKSGKTTSMEVEAIEEKEYYELSYNQKRLWFISQLDTTRSSFNMPGRIELKHSVEEEVIRKTIYNLVQRHESLRTGFKRIHGEPVQYVEKEVEIPFKKLDISMLDDEEKQIRREHLFAQEKNVSFDLNVAPLIRFILIKIADAYYDFIFNMHHIISDGWSMEILKKEFYLFYEGCRSGNEDKSERLTLQYKDYTTWHNKQLSNTLRQEQSRRFWREKLREGVPSLELPVTHTGDKDDFAGAGFRCILNKEAKEKLENLAQNTGSTLFMVMFSLYLMLLSRLANKEDVVCSIISAGREEANLQNIVGFFVNSILFSAKVDWKESFIDFINRVKTDTVEVYQHQYYPIEVVFKELKMKYPDIPASFNMENFRDEFVSPGVGVDGMNGLKPGHLDDLQDVKFDLEVYVSEYEDRMFLHWAYKKSLFNPATIEYIVNLYMELVDFFKDNFRESYASYKNRKKQDGFTRNN